MGTQQRLHDCLILSPPPLGALVDAGLAETTQNLTAYGVNKQSLPIEHHQSHESSPNYQ